MRTLQNNCRRLAQESKSKQVKGQVVLKVFERLILRALTTGFHKLVAYSLKKKNDHDRLRLKQKKREVYSQLMLLSEKDTKLRTQEAFLGMKEQKISEKEKEIKEKTKRLTEMNK